MTEEIETTNTIYSEGIILRGGECVLLSKAEQPGLKR